MKTEEIIKGLLKDFRGSYLISSKDFRIVGSQGYANHTYAFENKVDTSYGTASVGKAFTAVAILQLLEKGLLNLDDTIGQLIPIDWKGIDPSINVKQLLTHQSRIPDYFDEDVMEEYSDLWKDIPNYSIRSGMDLIPLFIDKEMKKTNDFSYNNSGYVVLGIIIENITKQSLKDYMKTHVFNICGMSNTGYYELDRLPYNSATSYTTKQEDVYISNIYAIDAKGSGAGGVFTTVEDLEKFWQHLFSYKLINQASLAEMMTTHSFESNDIAYGYGVWLRKENETFNPFVQGMDPGICAISRYDDKNQIMITLISNHEDNVWKLAREIKELL